ncbi:MAG TPA: hypothetical protein VFZ25_09505 [Chloroflexota bacterium]|nr:hypothetical protein [Chloroflexota bacterium]
MLLATIRDIAIILVAVMDFILLFLLALIALFVWRMVAMIRAELPPVVGSVKKTATTVEGTTDFITTTAAMPLIRAVSLLFAATRFVQVLIGRSAHSGE